MFTTSNGTTVSCLTELPNYEWALRLVARREPDGKKVARSIVLAEPNVRQYARIRSQIVAIDREVTAKFPMPEPPAAIDDEAAVDQVVRAAQYNEQLAEWSRQRRDFLRGEDAPYLGVMLDIIKMLADEDVDLDDLPPEVYRVEVYSALLEVWEAPLGGPAVPAMIPAPDAAGTAVPVADERPEPDSTESTPSSPPGIEPSPPSLRPLLTR